MDVFVKARPYVRLDVRRSTFLSLRRVKNKLNPSRSNPSTLSPSSFQRLYNSFVEARGEFDFLNLFPLLQIVIKKSIELDFLFPVAFGHSTSILLRIKMFHPEIRFHAAESLSKYQSKSDDTLNRNTTPPYPSR